MDGKIRNLDLNLLKVFVALYEERSVTGAADQLGLAQSSVSHALTRLRRSLGDPLFEKTTFGMQPTKYASGLAEPVRNALRTIRDGVENNRRFDPPRSDRTFNILASDLGEFIFLPELMEVLSATAPHLRVVVHRRARAEYRQALESGEGDLAVGQMPAQHTDFMQRVLLRDELAFAVRKDHWLGDCISVEQLLEVRHVVVQYGLIESNVRRALGKNASRRDIVAVTNNYLTVPEILRLSDYVSALPQSLIRQWDHLRAVMPPVKMAPTEIKLFWHRRSDNDPACRWLRETVAGLVSFKTNAVRR